MATIALRKEESIGLFLAGAAHVVLVLGPDELAKGVVTVKDMRKQDQFEVARGELVKTLRVELEQAAAMKV